MKKWTVTLLATLALGLPGCDYVVEGFQDGVEDYVAETTILVLEAILPLQELFGSQDN